MKITRFFYKGSPHVERLGIKTDEGILDVSKAAERFTLSVPKTLDELISHSSVHLPQLETLLQKFTEQPDPFDLVNESCIHYLPMSPGSKKNIGVTMNYLSHAAEVIGDIPTEPILFSMYDNALAAHQQDIPIPVATEQLDYEAELVVVIGKEGENISSQDALDYVFGYTVGNDFTVRDLQFKSSQCLIGKSLNYSSPTGPVIVTKDEIPDPNNLPIQLTVNGELRQDGSTSEMLFDVRYLIRYISQYFPLKPGDIIFTSTPKGVIANLHEQHKRWLKPNDEIEATIEGVGTLRNRLV